MELPWERRRRRAEVYGWSGRRQGYENWAGEGVDRADGAKVKGSAQKK